MKSLVNKSFLAPQADTLASAQLRTLLLNSAFTILINNYKSDFQSLSVLRSLIITNNGFSYHPNKNVKIRAFKGFNTVLSPDVLNGLVIFAFFNKYSDLTFFLNSLDSKSDLLSVSYFSLVADGHIIKKANLSFFNDANKLSLSSKNVFYFCNKIFFTVNNELVEPVLNKIYYILDAYTKSVN
jgi:hypothetical protein